MKRLCIAAALIAGILALAIPAGAVDQTVTSNVDSSLSLDSSGLTAAISNWNLAATGANTTAAGTVSVTSNVAYTMNVAGDKTKMSEYDTVGNAYVVSGKTLASALSIQNARTGGTAPTPAVAATAVTGVSTLLATGTGLGSDNFALTLSQPTVIGDARLGTGKTYRIVLTYSVTSTL